MTQPSDLGVVPHPSSTPISAIQRKELRQSLRQQRSAIDSATKLAWDIKIAQRLRNQLAQLQISTLAVYWPIQAEPDLLECFEHLHQTGMHLALPIVVGKGQALKFVPWTPGQAMENDAFGIPMPRERELTVIPDGILAPCVGFNQEKFRLGYGGGFYDRTLAIHPQAISIGIAYEMSRAVFAAEQYDLALNFIVTEANIY